MSANFKTVLVLGATSGLGEGFARRFDAQGKRVIAAGHWVERLEVLKSELKGLETFQVNQQVPILAAPNWNRLILQTSKRLRIRSNRLSKLFQPSTPFASFLANWNICLSWTHQRRPTSRSSLKPLSIWQHPWFSLATSFLICWH